MFDRGQNKFYKLLILRKLILCIKKMFDEIIQTIQ